MGGSGWPPILPRSAWTDVTPDWSAMAPLGRCAIITVHHSGFPEGFTSTVLADAAANLRAIMEFHTSAPPKGRGWADIGYHFAIDPAGRVWVLRSIGFQGAHVKNHNAGNVGIVCLGNFDAHAVPETQFAALREVLFALNQPHRGLRIVGHCEIADGVTSCPGKNLWNRLQGLQK